MIVEVIAHHCTALNFTFNRILACLSDDFMWSANSLSLFSKVSAWFCNEPRVSCKDKVGTYFRWLQKLQLSKYLQVRHFISGRGQVSLHACSMFFQSHHLSHYILLDLAHLLRIVVIFEHYFRNAAQRAGWARFQRCWPAAQKSLEKNRKF